MSTAADTIYGLVLAATPADTDTPVLVAVSKGRPFSRRLHDYCCGHCGEGFADGQTVEVADFGHFCSKACVAEYAEFANAAAIEEAAS